MLGSLIQNNCDLLNNTADGKVYWAEGSALRWITSMNVRTKYSFKWNSIRNINAAIGCTIGTPLY